MHSGLQKLIVLPVAIIFFVCGMDYARPDLARHSAGTNRRCRR
jgi:hypothetical protein